MGDKTTKHAIPANGTGFAAAFGAYFIWGLLPIYMRMVSHIPVMEVVANRIIWSLPTAFIILLALGRKKDLLHALKTPKMLAMACLTSAIITMNWSVYIWAIANNHAVDAALGYYINPLLNVLLGFVFLRERLTKAQWISVALAFAAVVILTIHAGGLPWVAVMLPLTFSFYGFFRKFLPIGPAQGFTLETMILFIPGLVLMFYFVWTGNYHFANGSWKDTLLLIMAGPITAIPLILFATGAKSLSLITLGLMQYFTPTFLFLIAVFVFKETFSQIQLFAFSLIWFGLFIYSFASIAAYRNRKPVETIIEMPPKASS